MKSSNFLFVIVVCLMGGMCNAQAAVKKRSKQEQQLSEIALRYENTLSEMVARHDADTLLVEHEQDPRYYRLFALPTFYESSVDDALLADSARLELYGGTESQEELLSLSDESLMAHCEEVESGINRAVLAAGLQCPQNFCYTESQVMKEQVVTLAEAAEQTPVASIESVQLPQASLVEQVTVADLQVKRPNFWKTSGSASLQFTQNYISGNWYKGGESTNTLVSELILKANYDDKHRIQWDNSLEAKLGFTTAPSDTMHKYRTNTDQLRLSTKLGVKAFKDWYYTIEIVSKTQMLRNYKVNSNDLQSAFLAPLETTVGVGMDFKKNLNKFTISVNLAPLAYRWVYVGNPDVPKGNFGVEDGYSLQEYGSSMKVNTKWDITKNITWTSRLEAFTNYEKVQAEWENTFDFAVSKYLSTKLFLHGRFDDGVPKKDGYTYFQFKEFLSFGLSYKW